MDHSEAIEGFCAIVGCSSHVAGHYLEACGWDVERSVDFYFQNPPDPDAIGNPAEEHHQHDLDADMGGEAMPPVPHSYAVDLSGEDEDMQRALAASLGHVSEAGAVPLGLSHPTRVEVPDDDDDEMPGADEDLAELARLREDALLAGREASGIMEGMANVTRSMLMGFPEGLPTMFPGAPFLPAGMRRTRSRTRSLRGPAQPSRIEADDGGYDSEDAAAAGPSSANEHRHPDLPEGVDAREFEEARMLEAALLGVPYEGHIPDFRNRPSQQARPADPAVREQRSLRWEQDQAFEESLAADRAKAEQAARAQREAEQAEQAARAAALAETQRQAREERELKELLARKKQALPPEPAADDASSITIMVRLPDGARQTRRYKKTDPLQSVFDYIDLQEQGFRPASYNLVTSYPRKVLSDGSSASLEASGINADTTLFLEVLK